MLLEYFYLQSIANNVCSYRRPNSPPPQVFKLSHNLQVIKAFRHKKEEQSINFIPLTW